MKITPELLAGLKEKAEKATPGPWRAEIMDKHRAILTDYDWESIENCKKTIALMVFGENTHSFIAAVNPAVILALIDKIEVDKATIEALRDDNEINQIERKKHYDFLDKLQDILEIKTDDKCLTRKIDDIYDNILNAVKRLISK